MLRIDVILKGMIESEHRLFSDGFFQLGPISIAKFVDHIDEVFVVFHGEILTLEFIVELGSENKFVAW